MKLIKQISVAVLLACSVLTATAQEEAKLEKGNAAFENYSFAKAIEQFEALTVRNTDVNRKLADSYRYTGNTEQAEQYYAQVVRADDRQPMDYYFYAQMLKSNGKYDEASRVMANFGSLVNTDSRAKLHTSNAGYYKALQEDKGQFTIRNLDVNTTEADFGPAWYGKQVVFASTNEGIRPVVRKYNWNGKPFLDLYVADKAENGDLSNREQLSARLNTKFHEGTCTFTADAKRVYFTRNNYFERKAANSTEGINKLKLFRAEMVDGKWQAETPIHFNSNEYSVGHPTLSADGKTLYFASDMPGGLGGVDIYKVAVKEDGSLGTPENLGASINTEGNEMFPFIHAAGYLFFASDGLPGLGGLDVFYAPVTDNGFGAVSNLGFPINDKKDDFSLILNPEMTQGYFASNRPGGKGDDDIYTFQLLKPLKVTYLVKGYAREKGTGTILPGAAIVLNDAKGNAIAKTKADENGYYEFEVEKDERYKLAGTMDDYFDAQEAFTTRDLGDRTEVEQNVLLEKDPGLALYCLVTDKETGTPLNDVHIQIEQLETGDNLFEATTPDSGDFLEPLSNNKLNDELNYKITLKREGYLAKTVAFRHKITEPGIINLHEKLDVSMDKIGVGTNLADIIEINPIYFDLNKSNIRPDAATELDKIVTVMNENPTMEVELGSHTDCRASKAYNESLSDRRAKSSAAYIKERISNPERIYGKGYGESQLINQCECEGSKAVPCSEEEHQLNRRTEFKIVNM